jgi:hypothetical protein
VYVVTAADVPAFTLVLQFRAPSSQGCLSSRCARSRHMIIWTSRQEAFQRPISMGVAFHGQQQTEEIFLMPCQFGGTTRVLAF